MMNQVNYQKQLDQLLAVLQQQTNIPTLLLHSCCAPCSSYVLEYLNPYFFICVLYYNPNISPKEEYEHRKAEQKRLIAQMPCEHPITLMDCDYAPEAFEAIAAGLEDLPEGGARCMSCYRLRLEAAARAAKAGNFDYFGTTLSISPLKSARALNQIGEELAQRYGVAHLPADFKKREGYKRSIELSRKYGLYRQNYCGCIYSKPTPEQ